MVQMVRSSASQQVMPISEEEEYFYDEYEEEENPEFTARRYRRKSWFDLHKAYNSITYENSKLLVRWLLQTASIELSFNVSSPAHRR